MPADNPLSLSRRQVLARTLASIGVAMTASQWHGLARAAAAGTVPATRFLDRDAFETLTAAVDTLVPSTDTPGAVEANVHYCIDLLLAEWAAPGRQSRWLAGLADFDRLARDAGADCFADATRAQRLALLQALDDASFGEGGPDLDPDGFYAEFKKLALFAYYSSEAGATEAQRYQRLPGDYRPCLPFATGDRAWFWNGYGYDL